MSISQVIGQNVVLLRKRKGLTQERLALEADMSISYLRAVEHGRANPTVRMLMRLAATLNEPCTKIISDGEDVPVMEKGDRA